MSGPPSSPPVHISHEQERQLKSALLPAFGHDSSPPAPFKPRPLLRSKFDVYRDESDALKPPGAGLPTPMPTSEANQQPSSPPPSSPHMHIGPAVRFADVEPASTGAGTAAPLQQMLIVRVPTGGAAVTVGRSSKSATFALRASNRLASRVHARLSFDAAENLLMIECLGWNGLVVNVPHPSGGGFVKTRYAVARGQILNVEGVEGVTLDVHGDRSLVELINDSHASDITEEESWSPLASSSPLKRKRAGDDGEVTAKTLPEEPAESTKVAKTEKVEAKKVEAEKAEKAKAEKAEIEKAEAEEAEKVKAEKAEIERVETKKAEKAEIKKAEAKKIEAEKVEAKNIAAKKAEEKAQAETKKKTALQNIDINRTQQTKKADHKQAEQTQAEQKTQQISEPVANIAESAKPDLVVAVHTAVTADIAEADTNAKTEARAEPAADKHMAKVESEPLHSPETEPTAIEGAKIEPKAIESVKTEVNTAVSSPEPTKLAEKTADDSKKAPADRRHVPEDSKHSGVAVSRPSSRAASEEPEGTARKVRRQHEPLSDAQTAELENVIINLIAFSRSSAVPLGAVRKANSVLHALPKSQVMELIKGIPSIGIIEGAVEDTTARKADDEYYYILEKDTNEERRRAVQGTKGFRSLRNCRKTSKQYYYRPLQLD